MSMGISLDVNAGVMIKALAAHDKVMFRHLTVAARKAVSPILADAKMDSPVKTGAMRDAWQIKKMRSRASAGYPFGYVVRNMTRQGAILEHAGSRSSGFTRQGESLIRNMTATYGQPGRFAWKSYDKRHVEVDGAFNAAVKAFEVEMNAKLGDGCLMAVVVAVTGKYNDRELKRAQADLAKLQAQGRVAAGGLAASFQKVGASMQAAGKKISSVGRTATTHLTLPLVGLGYVATKAASEYGASMTQVQAASDASAKQMNKLREMSLSMAEDFAVSGTEAAGALEDLVKAGLTPAQIAAGGLEQALSLATTGEMDASSAATILTNAMAVYGIQAGKSQKVTDSLVAAANATTASVSSLAQGLGNVGPVAAQAGLSIEQTSAALGALDQQGIKAAEGGTALKTFLLRLVPQTQGAATAMSDLGVEFTNRQGEIKPLTQVVGELQKATKGLSGEQRQQALTQIFGTRGILAANALMGTGVKKLKEYEKATGKVGGAQKLMEKQRDTEAFQLKQAQASLKNAAIVLGTALAPVITKIAGFVADLADRFAELSPGTQDLIVKIGLIAAAVGPLLVVFGSLVSAIGAIAGAIGTVIAAIGLGPLLAVVAAIGAAAFLIIKNWSTIKPFFMKLWSAVSEVTANAWAYIQDTIFPAMKKVWGYIVPVLKTIATVWKFYFKAIWATVKTIFGILKPYIQAAMKILGVYVKAGIAVIGFAFDKIRDIVNLVRNNFGQIVSTVREKIAAAVTFVREFPGKVRDFFVNAGKWLLQAGRDIIQGLINGIKEKLSELWDTVSGVAQGVKDKIGDVLKFGSPSKVMIQFGKWISEGLAEGIKDGSVKIGDAMAKAGEAAIKAAESVVDAYQDKMMSRLREIRGTISDYVNGIKATFTDAGSIGNVFSTEQGAASITDQLKAQVATAEAFAKQIKQLRKQGLNRQAIQQIVGLGATEGGAAATQLLADPKAIAQVNRFQKQLAQAGQSTGKYLGNQYFGDRLADARANAKAANQSNVKIEKGAVVVQFGDGVDKGDRKSLSHAVEKAVDKAMRELVREMRAS